MALRKNITADEIREMDEQELVEFLVKQCGEEADELFQMDEQELIDRIVDNYYPELSELHSECQDSDSMHPNETLEEFMDHEDY